MFVNNKLESSFCFRWLLLSDGVKLETSVVGSLSQSTNILTLSRILSAGHRARTDNYLRLEVKGLDLFMVRMPAETIICF